ncbi:MAG: histidine kinase [Myxococcaceae bacterium]|nr:histidine kinase [Myxococcaceae bacterium]
MTSTLGYVVRVSAPADPDVAAIQRIGAVPTILRVISHATGLRLTLIARVTENSWKACAVHDRMNFGLEVGGELDLATTLCSEVRSSRRAIVIDQASEDPLYCGHRTPKLYGLESYISVPIFLPDGSYFGNVCGLDSRPAKLKESDALATMELYAELIALQLEAERRQEQTQAALLDARETAELREQFIAVLGHDMRTPLGSIVTGSELLLKRDLPPSEHKVVQRVRGSAGRMARLVDDLLDFARGRLGGGIPLARAPIDGLVDLFSQVIEEARATHPGRTIQFEAMPNLRFYGDSVRLSQLLSNLLVNALEHGTPASPVRVSVRRHEGDVSLRVSNDGEAIPAEKLPKLFQPFFRGGSGEPSAGLGLGLYIVQQIVQSHGGRIEVTSTPQHGTSFVCTLPVYERGS